jgi:hypothetical protein
MRTILFLDDWPILADQGIDRRWFQAEPWPGKDPWVDPLLAYCSVSTVTHDPQTGKWRMWGSGMTRRDINDEGFCLCAYESADGFDWQPMLQAPLVDRSAKPEASHIVFSGEYSGSNIVFLDEREPDPDKRYKLVYSDLSPNMIDTSYGACRIATSPDGIHWTIDKDAVWRKQHVDTHFSTVYNPYTCCYQWTSRAVVADRRITLDQTSDWKHFEKPQIIVHPDPSDMKGVEFYGMPQFFYEGYFIGFLWREWAAPFELIGSTRILGRVDSELVYSVNGLAWNRTNRQSFLPDRGLGKDSFASEYPTAMILDDEGWLRVYTTSCVGEHNDWDKFSNDENISCVTLSRWRRDGFCALESHSDTGSLLLKGILPHGGPILLNAITGRFGNIRAELRKLDNTPYPGFELENSIPVTGDGHLLPLRWQKDGELLDTLDTLRDQPVRIYLELEQARLYAVRVDADLVYCLIPEPNLAGDYIEGQIFY